MSKRMNDVNTFFKNLKRSEVYKDADERMKEFIGQVEKCPVYQYECCGQWNLCWHTNTAKGIRYYIPQDIIADMDGIAIQVMVDEYKSRIVGLLPKVFNGRNIEKIVE